MYSEAACLSCNRAVLLSASISRHCDVVAMPMQTTMLEQHEKKKSEYEEWSTVVQQALNTKDSTAKEAVLAFHKAKQRVFR